jgi:hypothetical protein
VEKQCNLEDYLMMQTAPSNDTTLNRTDFADAQSREPGIAIFCFSDPPKLRPS